MNISNQSSQDSLSKQGTNKNKKHLHETSLKRRETTEKKSCQSRLVFSLESDWLRSDSSFLTNHKAQSRKPKQSWTTYVTLHKTPLTLKSPGSSPGPPVTSGPLELDLVAGHIVLVVKCWE